MKTRVPRSLIWTAVACGLLATAVPIGASDPYGICAIVEKVVFEPSESAPERIQIWGAFTFADNDRYDGYGAAQLGYVYYTCPEGRLQTCKNEWNDIRSVAGTGKGIGFGGRFTPKGRVRKATDKPESPDAYPIRMGVVQMGRWHDETGVTASLKTALARR